LNYGVAAIIMHSNEVHGMSPQEKLFHGGMRMVKKKVAKKATKKKTAKKKK
jgi:hypothetical protein